MLEDGRSFKRADVNLRNIYDAAPDRTVEVRCGDLFGLGIQVDLLVISAWVNSYHPDPGSMVAALEQGCGLKVAELATNKEVDLMGAESIRGWVSRELVHDSSARARTRFTRLVVLETPKDPKPIGEDAEVFRRLFRLLAVLPLYDIHCRSVATPLLNTGRQNLMPEALYPAIINAVGNSFRHVPELRRLIIFDRKEDALGQLCSLIDRRLHRTPLQRELLRLNDSYRPYLDDLVKKLELFRVNEDNHIALRNTDVRGCLADLIHELRADQVTLVMIGMRARTLLEALLQIRLGVVAEGQPLFKLVKELGEETGVSAWSLNAMHTVRTFGNWMGHANQVVEAEPIPRRDVSENDMLAMLLALGRILDDYPWPSRPRSPRRRTSRRGRKRMNPLEPKPLRVNDGRKLV
jgi:hypothetical protein